MEHKFSSLKAIIFDRDGTLNQTTDILRSGQKPGDQTDGYVLAPEELELLPAAQPALRHLKTVGIACFVFTQQNCIGKGLITKEGVDAIHAHMNRLLGPEAEVADFRLAWQVPGQPEDPRAKPSPAMILELLEAHGLAKEEVLVAGDSNRDYRAAMAAGVAYAWVRDDRGRVSEEDMQKTGCPVFADVLELAKKYAPSGTAL